jgi:hypothetical protein
VKSFAPGYVQLSRPGTTIVAREELADALLSALDHGTVYEWAAAQPDRQVLQGRAPVYVATLPPDGPRVVVRRNHHGGLLGALRGDRFLRSRIPLELLISLTLSRAGILTPEVLAQISYRVNALMRRIDVVTRELPPGLDLGAALLESAPEPVRAARWRSIIAMLGAMASIGVWHQDLNVKNIYLIETPGSEPFAALLDVDRVQFHVPGALVARANAARLTRSLRKWERTRGVSISGDEFAAIAGAAAGARASAAS